MAKSQNTTLLWTAFVLSLGAGAGSMVAGMLAESASRPVDRRGIMACAFGSDSGPQVQVISYTPGWEPPASWRCAVALEPREWRPEDSVWAGAISLELGEACGWSSPAGACCPECLAWESGCPGSEDGCGVNH